MQTIYKSSFCEYIFQSEDCLLIGKWFNTHLLTQETFRDELLKGELNALEKCKPALYMIDTSGFELPIAHKTQLWIADNISSKYEENGLKRLAFVASKTFIVQLSIEQTNNESYSGNVEKRHFDNEADALAWLKS